MAIPVGLNVWSRLVEHTFPYLDQTAAPFDSLWLPDHVQYDGHKVAEGWTLLTWALARYPDKPCGHEVLCNSFRNPAHLAKMVATAQALSGGRVILGIGAGWNEEEYRAYGWPYPPTRVRIAQLGEAIELIRLMWTEAPTDYSGEHYQIAGARCEPRPDPIPPVMVGGSGEKFSCASWRSTPTGGTTASGTLDTYAHKQEVLKTHCRAVGQGLRRDRAGRSRRHPDRGDRARGRAAQGRPVDRGLRRHPARRDARPGHRDAAARSIARGADRLTVNFADVPRCEGTWLFAATVLPHL